MSFNNLNNNYYGVTVGTSASQASIPEELGVGTYEVELNDIDTKVSKTGKPMITAKFLIVSAYEEENKRFEGSYHWKNSVILNSQDTGDKRNAFFFSKTVEFLKSLAPELTPDNPNNLRAIDDWVVDIQEELNKGPIAYEVFYGVTNKKSNFKDLIVKSILE